MPGLTGRRFGRYEILEQIGRGGMAAVYRAHDTAEDHFVAVKMVAPHLSDDPNFEHRFRREAEILMQLRHPNVIPIQDFGETDGYAYLVMPLLKVGTLIDRLIEGPVSLRYGAQLVQQISDALQNAHDHGVVHRDVKPANILLDERGNALLSDFGLARIYEAHASITGSMMVGTPAYMSPEQVRGERADARSDQYSLGVILYLLTTGELPFDAETPIAVALKHLQEPLPLIQSISPNVPPAVERVILKATAKDAADRFDSVSELNRTFQAAVAHVLNPMESPEPTIDLPGSVQRTRALPAAGPRTRKLRFRIAAAGGGLLALLLVYPVLASGGIGLTSARLPASEPAPILLGLDSSQLTDVAATMEVMSTELAGSRADLMEAEQVQTAVVLTLISADTQNAAGSQASFTPSPIEATETLTTASVTFLTPGSLSTAFPSQTPPAIPTEIPPTAVPSAVPTMVASETPSLTPVPSPTPTPDLCAGLAGGVITISGSDVSWEISNGGPSATAINRLTLDWPGANAELKKVRFVSSLIWNQGDDVPATDIQSDWKGNRNLPAGAAKQLLFEFAGDAEPNGYSLTVYFDNGCQVAGGG